MNVLDIMNEDRAGPLSSEEERDLIKKAQNGDKKASERLVFSLLRFVVREVKAVGKNSRNFFMDDFEDFMAIGFESILQAIKVYDMTSNTRLITLASLVMSQKFSNANFARGRLSFSLGNQRRIIPLCNMVGEDKDSEFERVAKVFGIKPRTAKKIYRGCQPCRSFDAIPVDLISGVDSEENRTVKKMDFEKVWSEIIQNLPAKDKDFIIEHFGLFGRLPKSLKDMAKGKNYRSLVNKKRSILKKIKKAIDIKEPTL